MTNKPTYKELEQRIKGLEQTEKALKERVKELGCISNLVKLVENSNTLEEVFTKFSTIIQPAMQHLDHVHSNLIVDGKTFYCKHGKLEIKPEWSYTSKIIVNDIKRGELIVFHDKDLTFLEEEKELCRILTERLEKVIERAETKQALKESERFFSQMFEQSIVSTQLLDPEGNTIRVNPPFCELFGVTPEDMKHYKILEDETIKQSDAYEPLLDVFNKKNSHRWFNSFDIALASESSGVSTTKPETVWLENLSYPILDKNGNLQYAVIQHHNITEKVEADKALQESEQLLKSITDNFPNSFLSVINEDYTIGWSGGQEFKNQGIDPNDFVGLTLEDVFGKNTETVRQYYDKTFAGENQEFELFANEQHQLYRTVALPSNGLRRMVSVVENITERKKTEEALKKGVEKWSSFT